MSRISTREQLEALLDDIESGRAPTEADLRDAPLLSMWGVSMTGESLVGYVSGHPTLQGAITTSYVLAIDKDKRWARTISRWYRLGESIVDSINRSRGKLDD
jgi:hypothetical protein